MSYRPKVDATVQLLLEFLQQRFELRPDILETVRDQPLSEYFLYLEQVHTAAKAYIPNVIPRALHLRRIDRFAQEQYVADVRRESIEMLAGAFLIFQRFRKTGAQLEQLTRTFGDRMVEVLDDNAYKPGWSDLPVSWFWLRMEDELAELRAVVVSYECGDPVGWEPVVKEAIDVANFAMMVLDNLEQLAETK